MVATTRPGGTFTMAGDLAVTRMGYGAMQLAGPGVFGPPADRDAAVAVLRTAVELGITHIDTSGYYGPRVTNQIIREALHSYPDDLRIVTKVGAERDASGGWPTALAPSSCAPRSRRTCSISASTRWTWSTCGTPASRGPGPARSPGRSPLWPSCGRKG